MTRIRWFLLIFGPLPILCAAWTLSAGLRFEPRALAARNDSILDVLAAPSPHSITPRPARSTTVADVGLKRACHDTADRLSKRTGGSLRIIERSPFVVAGDMSEKELQAYYADTIAPAVRSMQARYFRSRPDRPITVLVFRGEESYDRYAHELFGDSHVSIYGYYKPGERTVVVNIATGSGTLLHELTHALMAFEMPDVPTWFDEGLASLHEQCRFRSDVRGPWIEGLVNWRLAGLQSVIRQGRLRPLAAMVAEEDFRGPLVGTNYAQARYFCLYLQRKRILEEFVDELREHRAEDPRGLEAASRVLGEEAWARVDRDFRAWALELSE